MEQLHAGEWILGHQRSSYETTLEFALFRVLPDRSRDVVYPRGADAIRVHVPNGQAITEPSFVLDRGQMQAFMDTLWELGIRPKDRRFEKEAELRAAHLEDMRRLVFDGKKPADVQG